MPHLDCEEITVSYGNFDAVKDFSLSQEQGDITCLLGPSGCGKTTVLRAIAGFEPLHRGTIHLNNVLLSQRGQVLPPEQRKVSMVFQDFALFPHLTVKQNIAFGIRKLPYEEKRKRLAELLALIGLQDQARKYPHELSGGQQQRVAIARALAPQPDLVLMDEPFSSLDEELREQLAREIRELLKEYQVTAIVVTHDQMEAFALADRIAVMNEGKLQQVDTAYNLYHNPINRFVADFIGQGAIISASVNNKGELVNGLGVIAQRDLREAGKEFDVLVRPDDLLYSDSSDMNLEIVGKQFRGAENIYELQLPDGQRVQCVTSSHVEKNPGELLSVTPDLKHLVVFRKN
jgi:iron(III) transport system ATP-binding protein